jgi:adenosylhomocysteine nucleosidase
MSKVFIIALMDETDKATTINGDNIIYSGVGKINATMAAYRAFNEKYSEVINIGSCGSLIHPPGTIIKVGSTFQDIDARPLNEYGETPFEPHYKQVVIDRKVSTTCFTTDYFVDLSYKEKYSKEYINMIYKCDIFDMECFALAKVCHRFGIKFSSYKWVSDNGDGGDWKENCKIGFEKVKQLLNNE